MMNMSMKTGRILTVLLSALLLMAALAPWTTAASAGNVTYTVVNTTGSTFKVTRSGGNLPAETVRYRTVSLSAIKDQHFTEAYGELSFAAGATEASTSVTITENSPTDEAYKYQTGTKRSYRFEVLDMDGFLLASCEREITSGLTQFSAAKVSNSISNLVTMSSGNFSSGMSSSKYLDVSGTLPGTETSGVLKGYVLIDDEYEYAQKAITVSTSSLIGSTGASDSYLNTMGCKIYATICFTAQERDDGYQYVQILTGSSSAAYDGADPKGEVNTPVNSVYKVCYELSDGSDQGQGKAYFPHRGTTTSEFSLSDGKLHQQKYKSDDNNGNGAVVLPVTTTNITTRFDAGGNNDDTWGYKEFFVRMALCDAQKPTVTANGIVVSAGPYNRGNTFYISIPFSEIVTVSGTPTLSTTWGNVSYVSGSGSNVLTFKGTLDVAAGKLLSVSTVSGTIKDLAGNSLFTGTINKTISVYSTNPTYTITYDLAGSSVPSGNRTSYTYETATFTLNNPAERTGWTFDGWTGSNGDTPQTTVTVPAHSHGNLSYTVNWTQNDYSITAPGTITGGTVKASKTQAHYGDTVTLTVIPSGAYAFETLTVTDADNNPVTLENNSFTMPAANVIISATFVPVWEGSGDSANDPYLIKNTTDLDLLAQMVNGQGGYGYNNFAGKYFRLENNIVYDTNSNWNDKSSTENNYTAIGCHRINGIYNQFCGVFNGNGYTIRGIRIYKGDSGDANSYQGLFGYVGEGGVVQNLTLSTAHITGCISVGGIVGLNKGTVQNCRVESDVLIDAKKTGGDYHGGIVGKNSGGTVSGCTVSATVTASSNSFIGYGAVSGDNSGTISDCLAVDATVPVLNDRYGVIVGKNTGNLTANYYRGCTVGSTSNATNVGVGSITGPADQAGARSVHILTLGEDVTVTPDAVESVEIDGMTYYAAGTSTFTLGYMGTPAAGYMHGGYTAVTADGYVFDSAVSGNAINGYTLTIPGGDVTVNAEIISDWEALNRRLAEGGTVTLDRDYTATAADGPLTIPIYATVTLDLNGHTLDRALAAPATDGSVIMVKGALTLTDSSVSGAGMITGGKCTRYGGGVYVVGGMFIMNGGTITGNTADTGGGVYFNSIGIFTLNGGTITGNTAGNNGGGVYMYSGTFTISGGVISDNTANLFKGGGVYVDNGTFTLTGGAITGNSAGSCGGGVYVEGDSDVIFQISGSPVVTGNTSGDVYLSSGKTIIIADALTEEASIGVALEDNTGVFTSDGNFADNAAARGVFTSRWYAVVAEDGEAKLENGYEVIADENITDGTVEGLGFFTEGETVTLTGVPEAGYVLDTLSVTTVYDVPVPVSGNTFIMPAFDVEVTATFTMTWASLNSAMRNGGTFTLPCDLTATAEDDYLFVPTDKTVTIDLNGHTLDRHLTEAQVNGYVFWVNGTLILNDNSTAETGTITGAFGNDGSYGGGVYVSSGSFTMNGGTVTGNNAGFGGGVYVSSGSFTMNGGSITGNNARSGGGVELYKGTFTMNGGSVNGNSAIFSGGGVYVFEGTFSMTGGTVTGNTCNSSGSGVYVCDKANAVFRISGSPVVTGNMQNGYEYNVYLCSGKVITVDGALTDAASLGVTMQTPGVFTDGLSGRGTAANFAGNRTGYAVGINADGEAVLGQFRSVAFISGGGGGAMDSATVANGATYTLPECGFTAPESYEFSAWSVAMGEAAAVSKAAGETITVTANTTVTATFTPIDYAIGYDLDGGSVDNENPGTYTIESDSVTLNNPVKIGCTFAGWTGTGLAGPTLNVTIPTGSAGDRSYTATWTQNNYMINGLGDLIEHGSVTPSQAENLHYGDTVTLTIIPESGYALKELTLWDGSGNIYEVTGNSFVMPASNVTLSARFFPLRSIVIDSDIEHGTVTASATSAIEDEIITLTVTPDEGYELDWLDVNDSYSTNLSFNMPGEDVYVSAAFALRPYNVTVNGGTGGGSYRMGDSVSIMANAPAAGRQFVTWIGADGLAFTEGSATAATATFTMPARNVTVSAFDLGYENVAYLDQNGASQTHDAFVLTSSATVLPTGWYAVLANTTITSTVEVTGDVKLILCDGATLYISHNLHVPGGKRLTIYGQSGGAGALVVENDRGYNKAAIGGSSGESGGEIAIHGGHVTATGRSQAAAIGGGVYGSGGKITITGGTVDAAVAITNYNTDRYGAGIGGGWYGSGGNITITGGTVTAIGSYYAAGIGSGFTDRYCEATVTGGNITITGGTVTANGGISAAGIGGGCGAAGGTITISGGTVTANGGIYGAGIGGGGSGGGGNITITGGAVTVNGGTNAAGIGGGNGGGGGNIAVSGGAVTANGGTDAAGIGNGRYGEGGTVSLGWTDATDRIAATGYNGDVSSTGHFDICVGDHTTPSAILPVGAVNTADIEGKTLRPREGWLVLNSDEHIVIDDDVPTVTIDETAYFFRTMNAGVTLTVTPDDGYALTALTVTYADNNNETQTVATTQGTGAHANEYTFAMPASDVTVNAVFKRMYTVTVNTYSGGTAEADAEQAAEGDPITITVTPDDGWAAGRITVSYLDGNNQWQYFEATRGTGDDADKYTFTMPAADVIVHVYFGELFTITVADGITGGTVTTSVTKAAFGDVVTVTGVPAEGYGLMAGLTVTDEGGGRITVNNNQFKMTRNNVTVTAVFLPAAKSVSYIDENGAAQTAMAYSLNAGVTNLPAGWYVAEGTQRFGSDEVHYGLEFTGDAHLILADGCDLTAEGITAGVESSFNSLTVYGQAGQTGKLTAEGSFGMRAMGGLTLCGGTINATGSENPGLESSGRITVCGGADVTAKGEGYGAGIHSGENIVITGGKVTAISSMQGLYGNGVMISGGEVTVNCRHFGIVGTNGVSITGGRVTVTGYTGVYAGSGDITLGYTSAGDSITASSYSAENGAVTVSENKCFITDGDAPAVIPSGTVSDLTAIEGKTLSPALAVRIANDIENGTVAASGSELNGVKYNAYGASVTLTVEPAEGYRLDALTVTDANGNAVETTAGENNTYTFTMPAGNVTAAATFVPEQSEPPAFGTPTFTMPAALTTIEESAFEGMTNMTVVDAHSVTSVGKDAFRGCTGLTQIRLAKDCDIDPYAFTGCGTVYVYAPANGTTQTYCDQITNPCVFVEETDETLSSFTDSSGTVYTFPSGSNLPSIPEIP